MRRRGLHLNWRALALLGALLSILIDWPGLMVYAMPTLFRMATPQTTTTIATTTIGTATALAQQQDTMPLNIIQHKQQRLARDDDYDDDNDNDAGEVDEMPPNLENIQQSSDNSPISNKKNINDKKLQHKNNNMNIRNSNNNQENNKNITSESVTNAVVAEAEIEIPQKEQFNDNNNNNNKQENFKESYNNEYARDNKGHKTRTINVTHLPNYLLHISDNNHNNKNNINSGNKVTNELQQHQSDSNKMLMTMTSSDEQIHNAQRLKILNLISNKRKRKKIEVTEMENNEVTLHTAASLNNNSISHNLMNNITLNNNELFNNNTNNLSNYTKNSNNFLSHQESSERTFLPTTTAILSNNNNKNNYNNKEINENISVYNNNNNNDNNQVTHKENQHHDNIKNNFNIEAIATSSTSSTRNAVSTANVASTSTTATASPTAELINNFKNFLSFKFSSSHHTAILSRTVRNVRSQDPTTTTTTTNDNNRNFIRRSNSQNNGGNIVRRSSDNVGNGVVGLKSKRLSNSRNINNSNNKQQQTNNLDRNERSTISHLSGPARKIRLYIKNRFLQLMPDGTVNGTLSEQSDYTILQRTTVDVGRIKIQGVATCLYLCMDQCGSVYGSKDFTDDCVFNENMEQHNYNTYSSTYNSNSRRVYYLALNRHGEPRKLQIPPTRSLGKLATYTNAITETVTQERVEELIAKNFGANRIKHGIRQLCDTGKPLIELIDSKHFKARPKCNPNSSSSSSSGNSNISNISSVSKISSSNQSTENSGSSSSSNSNSSSSSDGHFIKNVPAANDKIKTSDSAVTNNISTNSSSLNSSNNNSSTSISNNHNAGGMKKKKKKRKCRPHENEEEHNCHRGPQALRQKNGKLKCKELQQQQLANGEEVTPCPSKRNGGGGGGGAGGAKKNVAVNNKKTRNNNANANNNNKDTNVNKRNYSNDEMGANNNKRGKKVGNLSRQAGTGTGGKNGNAKNVSNAGGGKKRPKNNAQLVGGKRGGNAKNKNKQQQLGKSTTTTPRPTTPFTIETTTMTVLSATTVTDNNNDPGAESTSDRGDREQRNVRFANSVEEFDEISAEDDNEDDNAAADDDDEETNEDFSSYEDENVSANVGAARDTQTPLNGGAADLLYYDQLDL